MAVLAVGYLSKVLTCLSGSDATQHILLPSYWFEMIWVDASSVAAKVI